MAVARLLRRPLSLLAPLAVIGALLTPATGASAAVAPTVVITSPAQGATVTDYANVAVTASTDPSGTDYPQSIELYVNGVATSGPEYCNSPTGAKTCSLNIGWSSDGKNGNYTEQVTMTTQAGVTVSSALVKVKAVNPSPTVVITTPTAGSTVTGADITVHATGTLDASQRFDAVQWMTLSVDGTALNPQPCGIASMSVCSVDLTWVTTGLAPGDHTLQATMTTASGGSGTSPLVHVTLGASPTVTLSVPAANATVGGLVQVIASGSVATGETPYYMILFVDHQPFGSSELCPMATPTLNCSLSLLFDTHGMSGQHVLQVGLFDTNGHDGLTTPITVTIDNPPAGTAIVTMTPGPTYVYGDSGAASGKVVDFATHAPDAGAAVSVHFSPLSGWGQTVTVDTTTRSDGTFTAVDPFQLTGNTPVTATLSPLYGSATASETIPVTVSITCRVPATVVHLTQLVVDCATPGLAYGSVVALHFAGTIPRATDYERVVNGHVTFKVTYWTVGAVHYLWATTADTRTFVAARSATYTVTVH